MSTAVRYARRPRLQPGRLKSGVRRLSAAGDQEENDTHLESCGVNKSKSLAV